MHYVAFYYGDDGKVFDQSSGSPYDGPSYNKKKKETSVNTLLFGGFIRSSIADDFPKLTVDKLEDAIYKSIKELAAKKQRLIFLTFKFSLLPYFLRNLLTKAKCLSKMRKICSFAVRFSFFS